MQNKTKIKIFIMVISAIALIIFMKYVLSEVITLQGNFIKHVYVRNILVKAELVRSETRIEQGLAGRSSLAEDRGMLFEMPDNDTQRFWMKGMRIPIDIIWIESGRVTGCEKNISPSDQRIFNSPGEAGYVLEAPEGFCDKHKVEVNDQVKI